LAASLFGRYLLLPAMPADIVTGAVLMLSRPVGGYGAADVHDAGIVMLGGSELIMTALALLVAARLLRAPSAGDPAAGLREYNAYVALLESQFSERTRDSARPGHQRARG
jgi:hypothetical protein